MGVDGHVRCWVSDAGEHEARVHLVIVQEGLVGLVHLSTSNLQGGGLVEMREGRKRQRVVLDRWWLHSIPVPNETRQKRNEEEE